MWRDSWFENLSTNGKLLWVWLLTNEYTNMAGIYEVSARRIASDAMIDEQDVNELLAQFENDDKLLFEHNHVILINFSKHQKLNTNQIKGAISIIEELPEKVANLQTVHDILKKFVDMQKAFGKPSESLSKPMLNKNKNKKENKNTNNDADASIVLERFDKAWEAYRKSSDGSTLQVGSKKSALLQFNKIKESEHDLVFHAIACQIVATPSGEFRPHLATLLNAIKETYKKWEDISLEEARLMGKPKNTNQKVSQNLVEGIYN